MKNLVEFIKESKEEFTFGKLLKYLYGNNYNSIKNIEMVWSNNESINKSFKSANEFKTFLDKHDNSLIRLKNRIYSQDDLTYVTYISKVIFDDVKDVNIEFYLSNHNLESLCNKFDLDVLR